MLKKPQYQPKEFSKNILKPLELTVQIEVTDKKAGGPKTYASVKSRKIKTHPLYPQPSDLGIKKEESPHWNKKIGESLSTDIFAVKSNLAHVDTTETK